MGALETVFAVVVTGLAALCVILALVVAAYWLAVQARRLRDQLRRQPPQRLEGDPPTWWRERSASVPTIQQARRKWS